MSTQTFHLPDVGEGLTEAEIVQWRVAPGDTVEVNDVLVEIETAKSLVELPSPFAGTVGELLAPEGDPVTVGAPIITIAGGAGAAGSTDGAITGWAFGGGPLPAETRMTKIVQSIKTPLPGIYQAGQWAFSPAGLPVCVLTGKLAADAVAKQLAKETK